MRTSRGLLALLALVAGLAGCPSRHTASANLLESAAEQAQKGSGEARTLALAGFHAYLVQGDAEAARGRFDAAIAKDPGDPYALMGQNLIARRAGAVDRALTADLELVARAPTHPLAVAAARYILDQVGTSPELDEVILKGVQKGLDAGAAGEAAQLLRGSQLAVALVRADAQGTASRVKEVGAASVATLVGPFSPHHVLSFDEALPPEKDGSLAGPFTGPYGPLTPRTLHAPDGRHRLEGEPAESDMYILAFDAEIAEGGVYLARTVASSSFKVLMDGALLFERRAFTHAESTISGRAVRLAPGKHRFVVKLTKESATGTISFALPRADGRPSDVRYTAATGPAPSWAGQAPAFVQASSFYPSAADLAAALEGEVGGLLASYLAARDGVGRDPDGTRLLLESLGDTARTPALLMLSAELASQDRSVPTKVSRGRATRDLEAVLAKDPKDVSALLLRAELALADSQPASAQEVLKTALELTGPENYPVQMLRARAAISLQVDAQAEEALSAALKAQPKLCDALSLRYSLARKRDASALMDQLVADFAGCSNAQARVAEHARQRGDLATAAKNLAEMLEQDPGNVNIGSSLASIYLSMRRYDDAAATLKELLTLWPRFAYLYKRLADVREYAGAPAEALALREKALTIEGSDLSLRRAVVRAKTGKEILQDQAIDGKAAIAAYESSHGEEISGATYVLDAAAVQVFPGGSLVNRIHTIQKALEQNGIDDIAEVNLPNGAQLLALRTIKADGTVLEPENIEGKDNISLPGVNVGDYVEVEYLLTESGRGPAQPGFAASAFFFQIANMTNNWSTYTVVAPKGTGMRVDAHGLKVNPPETKGDVEVFTHEARKVPPLIPEPDSPWSSNEYLPFVVVGAGSTGNDRMAAIYADAFYDRSKWNADVQAFARKVVEGKTGLEAVKALHAAIMQRIPGRDVGLAQSAISTLAQDRGSRLMLLKASLESMGIPARLAVVRPFSTDPAPYLFPSESLYPFVCVHVEVPGGEPVWVDTTVRFGPFGELPENAMGERDAYLLPEPGRDLVKVKTPPLNDKANKQVSLQLELKPDGTLVAHGEETYLGFTGASLAESFDALSAESRRQALQGAVTRYFGGAELTDVKIDHPEQVGAAFTLRYEFNVPRFARIEGKRMVLGPVTFPAMLGRRYVQLSVRHTPLFLEDTENSNTQATLTLPEGWQLQDPQPALKVNTRFGRFVRSEKQEGRVVTFLEGLRLPRNRVYPKDYEAFAQFAGDVDLIQTRDLVLVSQ
ncbi:tetratricopeptide repeat protein [Hyalangium versicolor]|uniref:tetratricopeptide repeat protein n=1 Tax=Hyalangium versicolor TaxID=2861190 RepID=UPI001CCB41C9|nr:tetratricopeptide repeat protein [Hyalangium versicolor]